MNTIEQARDVAECLRALTRNRNDGSAYLIAADTIDALIAELATLKADAERYRWLTGYLISDDVNHDDALIAAGTKEDIDRVIDAAMKGNHEELN